MQDRSSERTELSPMRSWFSKKRNAQFPTDAAGYALAQLATSAQKGFTQKLGEYGEVVPVEAFALGVFSVAWAVGNHERMKSLPAATRSRLFEVFYENVYAVAVKEFGLDERGFNNLHNRVTERFADFDGHAKLSFQPGATNQFAFGDLIAERLFGEKKGAEVAFVCFAIVAEHILACGKFFKELDVRG